MGTTVVVILLAGEDYYIASVGDESGESARSGIRKSRWQRHFGLIHFGSNRKALAMDTLMVFSFVFLGICELDSPTDKFPSFCALALVVFSFGMHCILNGMNYRYLTEKDRGGERDE